MDMPLHPSWPDIALRLLLTLIAGAIIGFDRGARGHAAGFRTTILVTLAASVAMIQANLLLPVGGKTSGSFAVMDVMRLPLGILTGVGFIGGGAILRRGDLVTGVTTAATLWLVTVIGLCLGGGQLILGMVATGLGVGTLWALKWVDARIPREQRARVTLTSRATWDAPSEVLSLLQSMDLHARFHERKDGSASGEADYVFELAWHRSELASPPLELLKTIDNRYRIKAFEITTENTP